MTFCLVYGSDGSGKSVQAKSIAELRDTPEHWSFAVKNRKLYKDSGIPSIELLKFNDDSTINPYQTIDNFRNQTTKTTKEGIVDTIIIDEITLLRSWAQPVVIEEINKVRRSKQEAPITKIGENNLAGWARVNQIVYGELERVANWAEIHDALVVAITAMTEKRRTFVDDEGKTKSVTTGEFVVDAKENIRKLADIRVRLERDGKNGRGYYMTFEKTQDWMTDGKGGKDVVKAEKNGLYSELVARGVI
jgi:hypothetical protein